MTKRITDAMGASEAGPEEKGRARWTRLAWFAGLWLAGVGAAMALAFPFRLLVQAAIKG